jgi:serine/threonine protein kinase
VAVPEGLSSALAGRYAIEREQGRGGMAVVYLAHDLRHARQVAVKVLRPELAATLGPERFRLTPRPIGCCRDPIELAATLPAAPASVRPEPRRLAARHHPTH